MRAVTKGVEKKSLCTRRRHAGKEIQGDPMSHALGAWAHRKMGTTP